jgi:hypothetical protein
MFQGLQVTFIIDIRIRIEADFDWVSSIFWLFLVENSLYSADRDVTITILAGG